MFKQLNFFLLIITIWCGTLATAENVIYKLPKNNAGVTQIRRVYYKFLIDAPQYENKNFILTNTNAKNLVQNFEEDLKDCYLNIDKEKKEYKGAIYCNVTIRNKGIFGKTKSYERKLILPLEFINEDSYTVQPISEVPLDCSDCTVEHVMVYYQYNGPRGPTKSIYEAGKISNSKLVNCKGKCIFDADDCFDKDHSARNQIYHFKINGKYVKAYNYEIILSN